MKKEKNECITNQYWDNAKVTISVVTPVYNRPDELKRAINSIEKQRYRNFEYIIINDGSTMNVDNIVFDFMNRTEIPVCYIKKANGGVHTARNIGTTFCRGVYKVNLDSDDELLPEALQIFIHTWECIPEEQRKYFREVVAQCVDQNGNRVGSAFPENINEVSWRTARKMCQKCHADHIACQRTDIMKQNLFPEPEGITFISEGVLWNKLDKQYRSYFINDMVRVYHTETEESYTKVNKENFTEQQLINGLWNATYVINHFNLHDYTLKYYIKNHIKRHCFRNLLISSNYTKANKNMLKISGGGTLLQFYRMYQLSLLPFYIQKVIEVH